MKRKLVVFGLALMLAAPMAGASLAYAGNYQDTGLSFYFSSNSQITSSRAKEDYTSSYMKCTYSGRAYNAKVMASSGYDVGSPWYSFGSGTTRYMVNYVKERGYHAASILGSAGGTFTARGLWSPDSI